MEQQQIGQGVGLTIRVGSLALKIIHSLLAIPDETKPGLHVRRCECPLEQKDIRNIILRNQNFFYHKITRQISKITSLSYTRTGIGAIVLSRNRALDRLR